jgi:hypothetical protein
MNTTWRHYNACYKIQRCWYLIPESAVSYNRYNAAKLYCFIHCIFALTDVLEYRQLLKHPKYAKAWNLSAANEFGRLAQGVAGRVKGTNTIHFIRKEEIPPDRLRDVTYIKFVCTVRTEKSEPNRT